MPSVKTFGQGQWLSHRETAKLLAADPDQRQKLIEAITSRIRTRERQNASATPRDWYR